MLKSVQIENFRGIAAGGLESFAPLTILTGPNGCGKSTVLEALLIGLASVPGEEIGRVVRRRPRLLDGARWLVGNSRKEAVVSVETSGTLQTWSLIWRRLTSEGCPKELRGNDPPYSAVQLEDKSSPRSAGEEILQRDPSKREIRESFDEVFFSAEGQSLAQAKLSPRNLPEVHMIDPGLPLSLGQLFSDAVKQGRRKEVQDFLRELVPSLETLEILEEKDKGSQLYVVTAGGAVPVATSGDGVQSFAQLAIQLAAIPEGLALIEEPEVYQHPRAIWQSARALLAAMRRGVQIVLSTHSLELIDALLGQAEGGELEGIALFNLALDQGALRSSRSSGEDLVFARQTLEHDLR